LMMNLRSIHSAWMMGLVSRDENQDSS
jgi:hypothetical protein